MSAPANIGDTAPSLSAPRPVTFAKKLAQILVGLLIFVYLAFRLTRLSSFMVHVDDFVPMAELIRLNCNSWSMSDIVFLSGRYTYPPGQFFLSFPLAALSSNFNTALFLYRLPSLAFWSLGLFGLYRLLRSLWPQQATGVILLPVILGVFSWRGFIESSQGYNYATTLPITVVIAWFVVTAEGQRRITQGTRSAVISGFIMGTLTWFSYQALFIAAAGMAALFLHQILDKKWRAASLVCAAGAGFSLPFGMVVWLCLRHTLVFASGVPSWAGGLPGGTFAEKLSFPLSAWFNVLQSDLTFGPWGPVSTTVAAAACALIGLGLVLTVVRREERKTNRPLLLFLLSIFVIFTIGPYLKLFPLGPTRHSFVLQTPLLLGISLALMQLRASSRQCFALIVLVGCVWVLKVPRLITDTNNKVDFALIEQNFSRWPDTRITDLPGGFTWEITYLARTDFSRLERIRWYLQFKSTSEHLAWLLESHHSLMVSHRGPMHSDVRAALLTAGAKSITALAEIPPGRGPELSGPLNGGNGFFLYLVER